MTDPAIMHVLTVIVGAISIFILGEVFIAIRNSKKRNRKGGNDDR